MILEMSLGSTPEWDRENRLFIGGSCDTELSTTSFASTRLLTQPAMNTSSVQNFEEAATIASEFIYSTYVYPKESLCIANTHVAGLDNLPSEVTHLLQEIKVKEARVQGTPVTLLHKNVT